MASDASAYAIGLVAVGRTATFKRRAARLSGILLLILGLAVVIEVIRRFVAGSEPVGAIMVVAAALSLAVNLTVLRLLRPFRHGEVHLRATWIFTRADVVANVGVIASAVLVIVTGLAWPDLVVGAAIGAYVVHEALEILKEAREAQPVEAAKL
jgi:Co/Zn/Cd efflux system component